MAKENPSTLDPSLKNVLENPESPVAQTTFALYEKFAIPLFLILFAIGGAVTFWYIDRQQSLLINSMLNQEESLFQKITPAVAGAPGTTPVTSNIKSFLGRDLLFEQSRKSLQKTFIILLTILGVFLLYSLFVIQRLRHSSLRVRKFADRTLKINDELQKEIITRVEMARQLERLNTILAYQALHDALTGLPNRQLFESRVWQIAATSRDKKQNCAVVLVELINLKQINEEHGHDVGDLLFKEAAKRLATLAPERDTFGRLGGADLIFVLPDVKSPEQTVYFAEQILLLLKTPFKVAGREVKLDGSVGISLFPQDCDSPKILINNAEIASYRAKNLGADMMNFFREENNVMAQEHRLIISEMRKLLANTEFPLKFNGIYATEEADQMVAVEAIPSLKNEELDRLPLDSFFSKVENLGFMENFGELLIRNACQQFKAFAAKHTSVTQLFVPVAFAQLSAPNFVKDLKTILQDTAMPPNYLVLAIPEQQALCDDRVCMPIIKTLNSVGVKIAITNFTSEKTSLTCLKTLPLVAVKLSAQLIQSMENEFTLAVLTAILAVGQCYNYKVIASGVNTDKQKRLLIEKGCNLMEGSVF